MRTRPRTPLERGVALHGAAYFDRLEAEYWKAYYNDTRNLTGDAYLVQEHRSWLRLRRCREMLSQRRILLALEEAEKRG